MKKMKNLEVNIHRTIQCFNIGDMLVLLCSDISS